MFSPNSSNITQLEFNQAMSDFKHMFPEMEEDLIESVLRENNGVVDATIDQLLLINQQESKRKSSVSDPPNMNENLYRGNIFVDDDGLGSSKSSFKSYSKDMHFLKEPKISKDSLRYRNRWDPPILGELPPDFLRITLNDTQRKLANLQTNVLPSDAHMINSSFLQQKMEENKRNRQISSLNENPELARYLEDERFAILLQNEEFVRELRMNHDFMSSLATDHHYQSTSNQTDSSAIPATNFIDSDAAFKERLRNMGKVSKKKFNQIAKLFSRRTRKNFRQLDNSANTSEHYFYQDLNNDNYEDVVPTTTATESRPTTSTISTINAGPMNLTSNTIDNNNFEEYNYKR